MALSPLVLAPLTILASRSLVGDANLSGQARRTAETNLAKQEAFLQPHRDALAGAPFQGPQGGALNAAEIAEVERRAVIDVDSAIAFGTNASALRRDTFVAERVNARDLEQHQQTTLERDLKIQEARRVNTARVARVASQANAVSAEQNAAQASPPRDAYDFRDSDLDGATVRAFRVGTKEFGEVDKFLNEGAALVELGNSIIDQILAGSASAALNDPAARKLQTDVTDYMLQLKGPSGANLGALTGPDLALLESLVADPTKIRELVFSNTETLIQSISSTNSRVAQGLARPRQVNDKWVGMGATNARIDAASQRQQGNAVIAQFFRAEAQAQQTATGEALGVAGRGAAEAVEALSNMSFTDIAITAILARMGFKR